MSFSNHKVKNIRNGVKNLCVWNYTTYRIRNIDRPSDISLHSFYSVVYVIRQLGKKIMLQYDAYPLQKLSVN